MSTVPHILETALPWKSTESIKLLSDTAVKLSMVSEDSMGYAALFSPVSS